MLSEPLLCGAEGLDVAGAEFEAEPDVNVEETEEVLLPVEDIDDVAMVTLPNIGRDVPAETGPAPGVETGIGMITAGPVMDGFAGPEAGAEGLAPTETGDVPAEGAVLQ